jgi:hypothetical protein
MRAEYRVDFRTGFPRDSERPRPYNQPVMRGKGSPALFELIRDSRPRTTDPAPPIPSPPARQLPVSQTPPDLTPRTPWFRRWLAVLTERGPAGLDRRFTIPVSTLFMALGGAIAAVVLVWVVGYRLGWEGGEGKAIRDLRGSGVPPAVKDPLNDPIPVNPAILGSPSPPPASGNPRTDPPRQPPKSQTSADPRQPGLNYLRLALLGRQDAQRAVDFLAANGLPAFFVPVDPPGGTGKNPTQFIVYAAHGVTRDELKGRVQAVREVDDAARLLGARWKKEQRSSTDFADRYWDKYLP